MNIKQIHAHFLISIGNYSNERIGFTVELEENETPEQAVDELRQKAIAIVGKSAEDLYQEQWKLDGQVKILENRIDKLRSEWEATAEFLRAQGIKPDAPSMPQFERLLSAAKVEEEVVIEGELESAPF